jgi:Calcineurin-like phosphoesterase/CARDB/Calx-beta domain
MNDTRASLWFAGLGRSLFIASLLISSGLSLTPQALIAAAIPTVIRGPYLQMGTPTGIVVRWRTSAPSDSRVCYREDPTIPFSCTAVVTTTTEHSVSLFGLSPDTTYYYSIGTSTETLAGGDASHFFVTPPLPGASRPTRIWVIGDSGTANASAQAVRDAYIQFTGTRYTDVWLMLGDNAYQTGTDSEYQAAVFDMYPTLLRQTVLWPTFGNHDAYSADSATQTGPYFDIFTLPTQGEAGGIASGTEAYYSFDYGDIHLIVLDSYESSKSPTGPMMTWLQNDLANNTRPWIIAYWHHPPYSKGRDDSDTGTHQSGMRVRALPILEAHGIDLVLAGHTHSYERSFLIDGHYGTSDTFTESMKLDPGDGSANGTGEYQKSAFAPVPHEGTVYAVAGSSAKVTSSPLDHPAMVISLHVLGSMVLDVNNNRLDAVFLDSTGTIRDNFTIVKGGAADLPVVTITASDSTATEAGSSPGSFLVSRTGNTDTPLTVNYTIGGTASNGSDYESLPTSVTIPLGSSTASITVTPIDDTLPEANETVLVRLAFHASYIIGASSSATVAITDDDANQPPTVDAGADQTITLPAGASLDGTVNDDGRPSPAALTTHWSQVSGPGRITFANASSVDTLANFSQSGVYVLRLTADDGTLSSSDDIQLTVNPPSSSDLIVGSLSISTKNIARGSNLSVSDTVKNVGTGAAGASTIHFYLSSNKAFDSADVQLGSRAVSALAHSEKNSGTTSITIPSGIAPGSYYVLGLADAGGVVTETRENNNTASKPVTVN